jgi:hypothetical protein
MAGNGGGGRMTEAEWLASSDPEQTTCWHPERMLLFAGDRVGERTLRLFVCACCRELIWHLLLEGSQGVIEVVERYADGRASGEELRAAHGQASADRDAAESEQAEAATAVVVMAAAADHSDHQLAMICRNPWYALDESAGMNAVSAAAQECAFIQDIVGNPFRPVRIDPSWLTPIVKQLARAAYEERLLPSGRLDPHRLTVLADALEEAGGRGDILSHLRGPGLHVRGCFAVDLLLASE